MFGEVSRVPEEERCRVYGGESVKVQKVDLYPPHQHTHTPLINVYLPPSLTGRTVGNDRSHGDYYRGLSGVEERRSDTLGNGTVGVVIFPYLGSPTSYTFFLYWGLLRDLTPEFLKGVLFFLTRMSLDEMNLNECPWYKTKKLIPRQEVW